MPRKRRLSSGEVQLIGLFGFQTDLRREPEELLSIEEADEMIAVGMARAVNSGYDVQYTRRIFNRAVELQNIRIRGASCKWAPTRIDKEGKTQTPTGQGGRRGANEFATGNRIN